MQTPAKTLILFDIDGTLTATNESDAKCYASAFAATFGFPLPTTDWDVYRHVTDWGIIDEVLEEKRGYPCTEDELMAFERQFVADLEVEWARAPEGFAEVPGATALLAELQNRPAFTVALATGGMRGSALYKLSRIGVDGTALPGAFANDAYGRGAIARLARRRANRPATGVVYVGDGLWDVRTSAALGMRFIGIAHQSSESALRALGATVCLPGYTDRDAFLAAVEAATVPVLP